MRHIVDDAASNFDWVILDAPPVGLLPDAGLVADVVHGTVFVVRAGQSQFPLVRNAIDALGRDRVLGVVLNAAEAGSATPYRDGYAYTAGESRS
jgi:Mrp family chromosome partitioning ATPase